MSIENTVKGSLDSFMEAFRSRVHGSMRDCSCGRVYFNPDVSAWTWEEGELERLLANKNATALDYAVETVDFEGGNFVLDCNCWQERALRIVTWLRAHDEQIAAFFALEKRRKQREAARSPTIGDAL